jgi:hypothetical protein
MYEIILFRGYVWQILERFQWKALSMIVDAPRIYKYQQLQKKSAITALNTLLTSAHTQTAY